LVLLEASVKPASFEFGFFIAFIARKKIVMKKIKTLLAIIVISLTFSCEYGLEKINSNETLAGEESKNTDLSLTKEITV